MSLWKGESLSRFGSIIGRWGERIVVICKALFVALASVLLMAAAIAPVRKRLIQLRLFDEEVMNEAVGCAFILTLGLMGLVYEQMKRILATVSAPAAAGAGSEILRGGVGNVYPHLHAALSGVNSAGERSLEVLGLTLYTAWPQVQAWLQTDGLPGWSIILNSLSPEYIQSNSELPATWANQSQAMIDSIKAFLEARAEELRNQSTKLSLNVYAGFPGVHGFRVGTGELLISFSHWQSPGVLRVDEPVYFYERFRPDDRSERAEAYRPLFASWIAHADRTAVTRYSSFVDVGRQSAPAAPPKKQQIDPSVAPGAGG